MAFEDSDGLEGRGLVGHVVHVLSQDWLARYEISGRGEGLAVSGVSVVAVRPGASLTPDVLRHLAPVSALEAATNRRWWATAADGTVVGIVGSGLAMGKGPGRPRHPLREIAKTAQSYVQALRKAGSRSVIDRVADERHLDARQVKSHLSRARKEGLLTPTTRGKAGGELTPLGNWHLSPNSPSSDPIAEHVANPEMFVSEPEGSFFEAGNNSWKRLKWDLQSQLDDQRKAATAEPGTPPGD